MRRLLPLLSLCASAALAQQEPTPFWMPPPPPAKKKEPAKKKKPVQVKPLEIKRKPPPAAEKEPPADAGKKASEAPTWIEPTPLPQPPPGPAHAPIPVEEPAPALTSEPAAPIAAPVPPPVPVPVPGPGPGPVPGPSPVPSAPLTPAPPIIAEPEAEPLESPEVRTWTFDLFAGGWAKSRSDGSGRSWDLAYGLRAGYGLFEDQLEVELQLIRSGGTSGSPFVSTSATHNLAALRAFWVLGNDLALLLGGGGGVAISQTHYVLLVDGTTVPPTYSGLDANAVRLVMQITAAGRVRVFRGLQLRGEVSAILRDGRIEPMPLLGLGWAL